MKRWIIYRWHQWRWRKVWSFTRTAATSVTSVSEPRAEERDVPQMVQDGSRTGWGPPDEAERRRVETTLPVVPLSEQTKRELRAAGKRAKSAVEKRDALITWAVNNGGSLREVAEAVGMSHTAVKFIAHGRPK